MSGEARDLAASIKARRMGKPFEEVLIYYGIERFLYRLSLTPYRDRLILKGGLAFLAWGIPPGRPTRDIDMRGFTGNSLENMKQIVRMVCRQPAPEDGLTFPSETITAGKTGWRRLSGCPGEFPRHTGQRPHTDADGGRVFR